MVSMVSIDMWLPWWVAMVSVNVVVMVSVNVVVMVSVNIWLP